MAILDCFIEAAGYHRPHEARLLRNQGRRVQAKVVLQGELEVRWRRAPARR